MNKKIIIGVTVVVVLGFSFWKLTQKSDSQKKSFKEYIVTKGSLELKVLSTGTVQPENRVEIKPPIAGRIESVLVKEGQKVKKGQTLAWMSSTERAALLDAALSKGAEELNTWKEMYRPTAILAPIDGLIIQRNVESGQTFTTQDAILVMSDRLTVKAQVDETDISNIKTKEKAQIVLDAYPKSEIPAIVDQIAYDAKTVNNVTTYIVDVLPNTAPDFMRSGMTANVTFQLDSRNDVLLIPTMAMTSQNGKTFVTLKKSGGSSGVEQEITTGLSDGKKIEVLSGLAENDIILVPEFSLENKKTSTSPFSPMGNRPKAGSRGGH